MNPNIFIQGLPFRRPKWRLERVVQLISRRPNPLRPGRYDDHYVRAYRRILLELAAADDDEAKREAVFLEYPHVCRGHLLHYSPDIERRQILEARLLTSETIQEIAIRFATVPEVIDYYEKLFFHVRDRLQCSDWIRKVIKGPRGDYRDDGEGVVTDEQRGYVYRLFAFFGGPLVLDAAVNGMINTTMPQHAEDVHAWFDDALNKIVKTSAAAAATTLQFNQQNMMQMIKLALRTSSARAATRAKLADPLLEQRIEQALATIGCGPAGNS